MILSFALPNSVYFFVDDVFQVLSTLCGVKIVGSDGFSSVFFLSVGVYYSLSTIFAFQTFSRMRVFFLQF
jgi:hypothetical protein